MNPRFVFSNFQMIVLMMGFMFGDSVLINPAKQVRHDAWITYLIGWGMGFVLVNIFIKIVSFFPSQNLIQILRASFGKTVGSVFGLLYIWFFLHIPAMILRNSGEFMINTSFTETPIIVLIGAFAVVQIYALKKGLDVGGRAAEILIYLFLLTFIIHTAFLIPLFKVKNLFPILSCRLSDLFLASYNLAILPFGEIVAFLMIFPSLENQQKDLRRVVYLSVIVIGMLFELQVLRDLLVLGPEIFSQSEFPAELSAKLIPHFTVDPLIASALSTGSLIKSGIFIYAAISALSELFNVQADNRIFVIPAHLLVIGLSIWVSDSLFEQFEWIDKVWPVYAFPFEILIPMLILVIAWFKERFKKATAR